jgi:protein SCO1
LSIHNRIGDAALRSVRRRLVYTSRFAVFILVWTTSLSSSAVAADFSYRGGLVSPPLPKPKFVLTDTSGSPFDFLARTRGYVTLLFFGFTHCPDMCPLQMHVIAEALKQLPAASTKQFKVVFVTTDPDRDTSQVLRTYLDSFDKSFIGLTGSEAAIDAAQTAAHLPVAKKSAVRPDGSYDVGHAAFVVAYSKDSFAHVIYPVGVKLEDWVHDLPQLATDTWGMKVEPPR